MTHAITECLREFKGVLGDLQNSLSAADFDLMQDSLRRKGELLDHMASFDELSTGDLGAILNAVGDEEAQEVKILLTDCKDLTDVSIELARMQNSRADELIALSTDSDPTPNTYNNKGRIS